MQQVDLFTSVLGSSGSGRGSREIVRFAELANMLLMRLSRRLPTVGEDAVTDGAMLEARDTVDVVAIEGESGGAGGGLGASSLVAMSRPLLTKKTIKLCCVRLP